MNIIALDIGGTNMRAALVDDKATFIEVVKENTKHESREVFVAHVIELIEKLDFKKHAPLGISIGVPGPVRSSGFINELPNIGIKDIDLISPLESHFNLPVVVRNDAEMAAFAEAGLGVGKAAKSVYFVTISTGIGGCLVVDKVIKNPSREIGHSLVNYRGNYYELEKIASGKGIMKLLSLNGFNFKSGADFFDSINGDNIKLKTVLDDWINLVANFFNEVNEDFEPDVIAVTGGVLKSKKYFWDELLLRLNKPNVHIAHFAEDAGLIGAALYGFKNL